MQYLYYIIPIFILIFIVYQLFIIPYFVRKKIKELFDKLINYTYKEVDGELYHYILENEELMYLVNVCRIPSNSSITINSKDTWSLTWGGNPKNKGRAYRNQKYLYELSEFLRKDYDYPKKHIKVVLLYPSTEKILRYLNESDIDLVEAKDSPYGYRVTTYANFIKDLEIFEGGKYEKNII